MGPLDLREVAAFEHGAGACSDVLEYVGHPLAAGKATAFLQRGGQASRRRTSRLHCLGEGGHRCEVGAGSCGHVERGLFETYPWRSEVPLHVLLETSSAMNAHVARLNESTIPADDNMDGQLR